VNVYNRTPPKRGWLIAAGICALFGGLLLFASDAAWRGWLVVPLAAFACVASLVAFHQEPQVISTRPAPPRSPTRQASPHPTAPAETTMPLPPVGKPLPPAQAYDLLRTAVELLQAGLATKTADPRLAALPPYRERAHIMGLIAGWAKWVVFLLGALIGAGLIAMYNRQLVGATLVAVFLLAMATLLSKGRAGKKITGFSVKAIIFLLLITAMSASGVIFLAATGIILVVVVSRMAWIWMRWYYTEIIADHNGFSVEFNTPAYIPFSDRSVRARRRSIPITEYDRPWWAEMFNINFVHLSQDTAAQKLDDVLHKLRYLRHPEKLMPFLKS